MKQRLLLAGLIAASCLGLILCAALNASEAHANPPEITVTGDDALARAASFINYVQTERNALATAWACDPFVKGVYSKRRSIALRNLREIDTDKDHPAKLVSLFEDVFARPSLSEAARQAGLTPLQCRELIADAYKRADDVFSLASRF